MLSAISLFSSFFLFFYPIIKSPANLMINSGFFLLSKDRFIAALSPHRFIALSPHRLLPPVGRHLLISSSPPLLIALSLYRFIALSHYLLPAVALCEGGASSLPTCR
jgi:hypothetical protein